MSEKNQRLIQDITMSLYSSLDLEKSLHKTLLLLKEYVPSDLVHVFTYDIRKNLLSYLAEATEKKGVLIDEKIKFENIDVFGPEDIRLNEVVVLKSSESSVLQKIRMHFEKKVNSRLFNSGEDFSVMLIAFDIVLPLIGGFGMVAKGLDIFDETHIKIMQLVKRQLVGAVLNLLHHREVLRKNEELSREKEFLEYSLENVSAKEIIGTDKGLKNVFNLINQVACLDSPVLISGETGTGKELFANAIHKMSHRRKEKMVKVNCGAIPESLMDSELFGHEKGAFTGAFTRKRGFFEQADKGTVFLDEIGELSLGAQAKLLRVLQTMEFHRVGGSSPVMVNVRVIAATNRDLLKMVKEKRFRKDLWFRLNVFPIYIPPLRQRKEDIKDLAEYFMKKKSCEMNLEKTPEITESSVIQLENYYWPGNVRELENIIERSLILRMNNGLVSFENILSASSFTEKNEPAGNLKKFDTLENMTRLHIKKALEISGCKIEGKDGAARLLGMNPSTLRSKMKKLGIVLKKHARYPEDEMNAF
ncbi:MAG: sigma 54-interacting transcriptional regulator [Desulfobacteraceae bacterium]|nr:sigma 54-interacting transcriptional regulator [Desulfobacteraceae bacterium]